ncbi:hypothetical protein GDO81_012400 [Engystomops pustulosus]|uniref:Uncharacterized protein n=1 Tax=Engystomops pustulosus TaxID=76066 RepID=A0AAV7BLR9_ENGPU|nr:hypothetical protein GDO81_012400 [Engystomops pustulosus]
MNKRCTQENFVRIPHAGCYRRCAKAAIPEILCACSHSALHCAYHLGSRDIHRSGGFLWMDLRGDTGADRGAPFLEVAGVNAFHTTPMQRNIQVKICQ